MHMNKEKDTRDDQNNKYHRKGKKYEEEGKNDQNVS